MCYIIVILNLYLWYWITEILLDLHRIILSMSPIYWYYWRYACRWRSDKSRLAVRASAMYIMMRCCRAGALWAIGESCLRKHALCSLLYMRIMIMLHFVNMMHWWTCWCWSWLWWLCWWWTCWWWSWSNAEHVTLHIAYMLAMIIFFFTIYIYMLHRWTCYMLLWFIIIYLNLLT